MNDPTDLNKLLARSKMGALLADPDVTDIMVQEPGRLFVDRAGAVRAIEDDALTAPYLTTLAKMAAVYNNEGDSSFEHPLFGGTLPTGARIQVVQRPCVDGEIAMAIRVPSRAVVDHQWMIDRGVYDRVGRLRASVSEVEALYEAGRHAQFLERAVALGLTVFFVGEMGSAKTTMAKALSACIPAEQRLVSMEDTREFFLPHHPNRVHLLYRKNPNAPGADAIEILEAILRLNARRILVQEVRGAEAYPLLRALMTGHAGMIGTAHARSATEAFDVLALCALQSPEGKGVGFERLSQMFRSVIDVVVHMERDGPKHRRITEILYQPREVRP